MNKFNISLLKNQTTSQDIYTILLPPPNITGNLHIGHFFNWSIQDVILRNKFINNHLVNWNLGLDHAGIATQYIVEKKLNLKNQTREEIGKEKFQELIWTWKEEAEKTIIQQAHEFELLMDWEKSSFTMDLDYQLLVKKSFIKLYNDNLIYKELKITNWDVKFQTAISDLEVIEKEVDTVIYILYITKHSTFLIQTKLYH